MESTPGYNLGYNCYRMPQAFVGCYWNKNIDKTTGYEFDATD